MVFSWFKNEGQSESSMKKNRQMNEKHGKKYELINEGQMNKQNEMGE